uniref:Uncharacterized protein n=1 Tax=Arundo donax TaxID=35708 RepID=A0A0A9AMS8_ARUDO
MSNPAPAVALQTQIILYVQQIVACLSDRLGNPSEVGRRRSRRSLRGPCAAPAPFAVAGALSCSPCVILLGGGDSTTPPCGAAGSWRP